MTFGRVDCSPGVVPLLLFGLSHAVLWIPALRHFDGYTITPLILCAILSGWWTVEKPWFTAIALSIALPIMASGSCRGQLLISLIFPPLWPYLVLEFGPVYLSYFVLVCLGYGLRRLARRRGERVAETTRRASVIQTEW